MELRQAREIVEGMVETLRPHCERIEIAGSIRRGNKVEVKDGDVVAIPKPSLLPFMDDLLVQGGIEKALYGDAQTTRWGPKLRGMVFRNLKIEIQLVDTDNWGYIHWLRTGPYEANVFIMKWLKWKRAPIQAREGYWWWGEKKLRVATEEDMFALLGMPFIAPVNRDEMRYRVMLRDWKGKWPDFAPFVIEPVKSEQAELPGLQTHRWLSAEDALDKESDRGKQFEAEKKYWRALPVTSRMQENRAQMVYTVSLPVMPEKLLSGEAFCRIRDQIALAEYVAKLPVLLERCTTLRQAIADLRVKIKVFHWYLDDPDLPDRNDWIVQRDIYKAEMIELYRILQPLEAEYMAIQADVPVRLERLGLAQRIEAA